MRMHCCQLKSDIFRNNISNNRFCTCGDEETVFHFFFEFRNYTNAMDILINETVCRYEDSKCLMVMNIYLPMIIPKYEAVSKFIVSSKRFTIF